MSQFQNKHHSFSVEDAQKYGVEKAIILQHIKHWCDYHLAHEKHIYTYDNPDSQWHGQDFVFTFFTADGLTKMFDYLGSRQKIARLIRELENDGVLISGKFSKNKHDQTKSYSIPHFYSMFKNEQSNVQDLTIECSNLNNGMFKNEHCYRSNNRSNNRSLSLSTDEKPKIDDNQQMDIEDEKISYTDLTLDEDFTQIATMVGFTGDVKTTFFKFIGHSMEKQYSFDTKGQWLGKWQKWVVSEMNFSKAKGQRVTKPQNQTNRTKTKFNIVQR